MRTSVAGQTLIAWVTLYWHIRACYCKTLHIIYKALWRQCKLPIVSKSMLGASNRIRESIIYNPLLTRVIGLYRGGGAVSLPSEWQQVIAQPRLSVLNVALHSKQYSFFKKNLSVLLPCNPRRTLQGFFWGCMVIVLKGSLYRTYIV